MGHVFVDLELNNPKQETLQPIKVKALADIAPQTPPSYKNK